MYYKNRYYDAEAGRFIQNDPIGYWNGLNLYQYTKNRPTQFSDPMGLSLIIPWQPIVNPNIPWPPLTPPVLPSNPPSSSPLNPTPEKPKTPVKNGTVQVCCGDTQINCAADFLLKCTGNKHCWLKTSNKEAGMGAANTDNRSSNSGYSPTQIIDHTGESLTRRKVKCYAVPICDADCVDKQLEIGKNTGKWTPLNQCNSLITGILTHCKCRNKCLKWSYAMVPSPYSPWGQPGSVCTKWVVPKNILSFLPGE